MTMGLEHNPDDDQAFQPSDPGIWSADPQIAARAALVTPEQLIETLEGVCLLCLAPFDDHSGWNAYVRTTPRPQRLTCPTS